jgi:phage protein D
MPDRAIFAVSIDGSDVTGNLADLVERIHVHSAAGEAADRATIDLDDSGGAIRLPRVGAQVTIALGWEPAGAVVVFDGTVDDLRSTGGRGGGRRLAVSAKSFDSLGKAKEHKERHWDDATLQTVMSDAGSDAGVSVAVHPSLASITRPWWGMAHESFLAFGQRLARELDATFKLRGTQAVMVPRGQGVGAGGSALPDVAARVGDNVLSWSIAPTHGRPRHAKYHERWYDRAAAKWQREAEAGDATVTAESTGRHAHPDQDTARRRATSAKTRGDRDKGGGTVAIDGDPAAQPEANCMLSGARPGIDGAYRIDVVEHDYSRGEGFRTTLGVKQPSGAAGTDSRIANAGAMSAR